MNSESKINQKSKKNIDQMVFRIAGCFILGSLLLAHFHNTNWLWFTAFVGANMFQSTFTGFCLMANILKKIGIEPGRAYH
jgi:hypothetical protein